jgi:hypothetical protein
LSNLWRNPQTPFLAAAIESSGVVRIEGVQDQKQKLKTDGFPPALYPSGGLAEVRPHPEKIHLARPQLERFRPGKSLSLNKTRHLKAGTPSSELGI